MMIIGIPKEVKDKEFRVGLTPHSVHEAVGRGHSVWVEKNAGAGIGASDADYRKMGAKIAASADEVFARAGMIVKVKEPQPGEIKKLRPRQLLFTYLHLAAAPALTRGLMKSGAICVAYETVTDEQGGLPLLAPMSQVAGRLAPQMAAYALMRANGGCGKLLGGVPGVLPARVVILGGGMVGRNAARIALGMGARVAVAEKSPPTMDRLHIEFGAHIETFSSTAAALAEAVAEADVVIGGVLVPGESAPKIVGEEMIKRMRAGSVVVDVAIDQGGCIETARPTTHSEPVYLKHGVVHYCVTNMPGAVPRTSSYALNNATLPFVLRLAADPRGALAADPRLRDGLSVIDGALVCPLSAKSLGIPCRDRDAALAKH